MFKKTRLPLRKDETIIEVIRPIMVHRFFRVLVGFGIICVATFFTFWLWQRGVEGQVFYIVLMLLGVYLLFYDLLFERSNYLVVTTERVFDVHRESMFNETISSLNIVDLVDIVVVRRGMLQTILNYGLITLHPKEGTFTLEFERIRRPAEVQDLLFEHRDRARKASRLVGKDELLKQFLRIIPDLSEAELTLLYQKIHSHLLSLAGSSSENQK